jgi:phosphoribosylanthranilate isomerase
MMKIKVCGLREPGNIREVVAIQGIDLIGMIFYNKSPRYVDSDEPPFVQAELKNIGKVGVFVNEPPKVIADKGRIFSLEYIQLHGNETPGYLRDLKQILPPGTKFIKAFSIGPEYDFSLTSGFEGLCEYFLFDTPAKGFGGSGKSFNWETLSRYDGSTPFLLSGGIGPESIQSLRNFKHRLFAGVDLNSRFETVPALKNAALLSEFVQQLKSL